MNFRLTCCIATLSLLAAASFFAPNRAAAAASLPVTRATLANGLRVVVVHDPLAPVVTTMMNYRVGSDDQPIDGLAHATEHMMFRGSKTLSSSLLMDSMEITGGDFDADTQSEITQYYFTVPSQYLDIAMRLERSRATGLLMSQSLWNQELGAITQEVTQDNSSAIYRIFVKMQNRLLAGTPYAKNGLGTVAGFAHQVNSKQLLDFYRAWYHPNNATYVIVGDVDGPATIAKVKAIFGNVPSAKLPARAPVRMRPVTAALYRDTSDQPFTAVLLGYRLPGYNSPDYAAGQILADVLNSQRGDLHELQASGKAYFTGVQVQQYPQTTVGIVFAAVPITTKPEDASAWMRGVIDGYRRNGVPDDLVASAKLREISQLEFSGNSIEDLAFEWSTALAVQGLNSPDDMTAAYQKVTTADVNRVLRAALSDQRVVSAYAVPKNLGKLSIGAGGLGKEDNSIPPSRHEPLPPWAQTVLDHLHVPRQTLSPVSMTLSNGIRLIVQTERITRTVVVSGQILSNAQVQEPVGQDGVADIAASLLPYGTTTYDRIGFQRELDKIAASTDAGTQFSLQVLTANFDRGVQLLADEELHPAFGAASFAIVKKQQQQGVADEANSPDHLAEVALANALYPPNDPQRRFATTQSVESVTLDDVKAWYSSAYRPDLTTIVVIGDVSPDQAKATFEKYFSGWTASGPKPNIFPPPVANNVPSSATVPATGRVQSSVQLVETVGVRRADPDFPTMAVFNAVLTGGFYSSLLYHDVREVHGYAYSVDSSLSAGKVRSTFTINYGSDPSKIVPAEDLILRDLRALQRQPAAADRILRSKALLMGEVPIRQASYDGVSGLLLSYATRDLPLNQNMIDAQRELSVTSEMMRAAIAKWIRPDGFVRIITGPGPR